MGRICAADGSRLAQRHGRRPRRLQSAGHGRQRGQGHFDYDPSSSGIPTKPATTNLLAYYGFEEAPSAETVPILTRRWTTTRLWLRRERRPVSSASRWRTPTRTPIYATTFEPLDRKHAAAVAEFKRMFALSDSRGYIDVRGVPTGELDEYCRKRETGPGRSPS